MENSKGILLWIFGIIIGFFWLVGYVNEKSLDYHYTAETPMTIESYCNTIFEMYDYDLEDENYEHESCRIYYETKAACEYEIVWTEWYERCRWDLWLNKYNVLNNMKATIKYWF